MKRKKISERKSIFDLPRYAITLHYRQSDKSVVKPNKEVNTPLFLKPAYLFILCLGNTKEVGWVIRQTWYPWCEKG